MHLPGWLEFPADLVIEDDNPPLPPRRTSTAWSSHDRATGTTRAKFQPNVARCLSSRSELSGIAISGATGRLLSAPGEQLAALGQRLELWWSGDLPPGPRSHRAVDRDIDILALAFRQRTRKRETASAEP